MFAQPPLRSRPWAPLRDRMTLSDPSSGPPPSLPAVVYSARSQSGPTAVLRDLAAGARRGPLWRAFAWDEIKNRYRRSALGLAWIVISYLVFVGGISLFFGGFSALDARPFLFYVAIGFTGFTFLVGNIIDGCAVFKSSASWIKSTNLPYSIYVYKSVARSLFPFGVQLITGLIFIFLLGWRPSVHALLVIPAILVFLINACWVQLLLGHVAARWRDIEHLVGAITRLLFFISPVMWVFEERTGIVRQIALVNPTTHFLEVFRIPLLGGVPTLNTCLIVAAWTILGWSLAIASASVMRRRLPYWV